MSLHWTGVFLSCASENCFFPNVCGQMYIYTYSIGHSGAYFWRLCLCMLVCICSVWHYALTVSACHYAQQRNHLLLYWNALKHRLSVQGHLQISSSEPLWVCSLLIFRTKSSSLAGNSANRDTASFTDWYPHCFKIIQQLSIWFFMVLWHY